MAGYVPGNENGPIFRRLTGFNTMSDAQIPPTSTEPEDSSFPGEFVPLSSVIVPEDRHRKEFDPIALAELGNSIRAYGLFHAIQVREDGRTLVSGERRFRVLSDPIRGIGKGYKYGGREVPPEHVPVIRVATADPLELEEIELDENIRRRDLSWQELAETTSRLRDLRLKQANREIVEAAECEGEVTAFLPAKKPTLASLAEETRKTNSPAAVESVRAELIVSQHMKDPEVAGAKSLTEALKVVKKKDRARQLLALGAEVGKTFSASLHQVINEDCRSVMLRWASEENGPRFDVILTDPPYGMGAHQFGDGAGRLAGITHEYDDTYENWKDLMPEWCKLAYAVAKPEAHAYVFCDIDRFHELKEFMLSAGWYVFRTPFINVKRNSGRVPLPDKGPRRQYEILLYAIKGGKLVNSIQSDVLISEGGDETVEHGAQKPVELYIDLLRRSVKPGDIVLDAFGGSGTIIPACHELRCVAYCIEQSPTSYGLCLERIGRLPNQQKELDV